MLGAEVAVGRGVCVGVEVFVGLGVFVTVTVDVGVAVVVGVGVWVVTRRVAVAEGVVEGVSVAKEVAVLVGRVGVPVGPADSPWTKGRKFQSDG